MSEEALGFGSGLGWRCAQGAQPGVGTLPLLGHGVVWPQGGWRATVEEQVSEIFSIPPCLKMQHKINL